VARRCARRHHFARGSCAGFDCLSNKGLVFARIQVPGVPGTVDLFNTHIGGSMCGMGGKRTFEIVVRRF
jgi:hypothetical protein